MKTVYLSHFSIVINPGENQFLPYSSATLWSYAQTQPDIVENYQLGAMFFEKQDYNQIVESLNNPSVFGMSCYVWNANYNDGLAQAIKQQYPECLIVYGGPQLPQRSDDKWWEEHPYVDVVVYYEGEKKFVELLRCDDRAQMAELSNVCVNFGSHWTYSNDPKSDRIRDLKIIPSPYASNLFTEVKSNHSALFETHRGCPYACTFCDWGSLTYSKVTKYDIERIRADIEWAGQNKIGFLYNVDANFGLFKDRDHAIVDILIETKEKYGYPKMYFVNWAKMANEDILQMAKKLYDAGFIKAFIMSLQTLTEDALTLIKRDNMDINKYGFLANRCKELDLPVDCELILGNPGETVDSWKQTYITLADFDQLSTQIFPLGILPGAELASPESRQQHGIQTIERPFPGVGPGYRGDNGDASTAEYMEQIYSTNWLTNDDIKYLFEWTWCTRLGHEFNFLRDYANYLDRQNICNKIEFYDRWYKFVTESSGSTVTEQFDQVVRHRIADNIFGIPMQSMGHRVTLGINKRDKMFNDIRNFVKQFDIDPEISEQLVQYCDVRMFNPDLKYPHKQTFDYNFLTDTAETVTIEFTPTLFGAYSSMGQHLLEGSEAVTDNYKFRSGMVCTLNRSTII